MKNLTPYVLITSFILLCNVSLTAQNTVSDENIQKSENKNYQKLKNLGYAEKEIYQDLGNANFLLEKYEKAVYWYSKLNDLNKGQAVSDNYQKRYQFALEQTTGADTKIAANKNWLEQIKDDYQLKTAFEQRKSSLGSKRAHIEFDFQPNLRSQSLEYLVEYERNKEFRSDESDQKNTVTAPTYEEPIAVTADGQTAYFSKAIFVKPAKGIFSKMELVHRIYRTDKINGQWKNVRELELGPKNYSVKHPTISANGNRLYFASNMPGSYGKYDIYATDIASNGTHGPSKNLGTKVNTKKNDLYPNLIDGNTLVFASEGRKGYGGLDLYMTEVAYNRVELATNLGSPINSTQDDFSMYLLADKGIGYVLSNRGKNSTELQQVAFSYSNKNISRFEEEKESSLKDALNNRLQIDYTTSVFQDK